MAGGEIRRSGENDAEISGKHRVRSVARAACIEGSDDLARCEPRAARHCAHACAFCFWSFKSLALMRWRFRIDR